MYPHMRIRPFDNAQEMDEAMIERWNNVVKLGDKVYHLGDVAIPKRGLLHLPKLNGRKCLIKGNHDIHKLKEYVGLFYDIRSTHVLGGMVLTHVPIHPNQLHRFKINVHGHMHENVVAGDSRYINICVEHTNYTPIALEEVEKLARLSNWPK